MAMPARSMSFIVKTRTPESRTISFSRSSRLRMPISTVCSGSTFGEKPPIRDSSDGSGPSSAASGMPCTLPLPVLAGVFMSPWASTQMSPMRHRARGARSRRSRRPSPPPGCDRRRARAGCRLSRGPRARSCRASRRPARSRGCTSCAGSPSALTSGIGATRSPSSTTVMPRAVEAFAEAGDAERRGPHVHAAAVAAKVERRRR